VENGLTGISFQIDVTVGSQTEVYQLSICYIAADITNLFLLLFLADSSVTHS
jgi:hypothetical protein